MAIGNSGHDEDVTILALLGDPGETDFWLHCVAVGRFHHQLFQPVHAGNQAGELGQAGEAVVKTSIAQSSNPSCSFGFAFESSRQLSRLTAFPDQDVFVDVGLCEFLEELVHPSQRTKVLDGANTRDHHFNQLIRQSLHYLEGWGDGAVWRRMHQHSVRTASSGSRGQ